MEDGIENILPLPVKEITIHGKKYFVRIAERYAVPGNFKLRAVNGSSLQLRLELRFKKLDPKEEHKGWLIFPQLLSNTAHFSIIGMDRLKFRSKHGSHGLPP